MKVYSGACSCGQVVIEFFSMLKLLMFIERRCDCDFCKTRDIAYISDPLGRLNIISHKQLKSYQQGSMQAEFLACPDCDDVICASYQSYERTNVMIGSCNARLLDDYQYLGCSETVSPKKLTADEKLERWNDIWMPIAIK